MRCLFVVSFFVSLLLSSSFDESRAQSAPPYEQQYTVLGVNVAGNRTGDAKTIISQSGLYQGQKFTVPSDAIRGAITRLWSQGLYRDIDIVIDKELPQTDNSIGVFLTIHVRELPRLGNIVVSGNKEVKAGEIEKALGLRRGDFLRPWEIASGVDRVKALYEKEGYHFATIETSQQYTNDSATADLSLTVNEGREVTVRTIEFVGNERVSSSDLRGAMEDTHEKRWWKLFTSGSFDESKFKEDEKRVLDFYHSRGYRDASILGDSIWVTNGEDLHIRIRVYEGPQYHIRNIAVTGADVFTPDEVREHLGFRKGDIYDMVRLQQNLQGPTADYSDVGSLYFDRGYLAQIAKEETVIPGDSIDLLVRVNEGKEHFFRYVDIKGNSKTKDYVIRRELFTKPGDPFSRAAIIRSIRQLAALNYFNQEKLQPDFNIQPDATDVDITYNVEERSSDTFNASIGYGGSLGLTGSVGLSFNNFDITDPFRGGGGEVLSLDAQIGAYNSRTFSLSFMEPWLNQTPTSLGFSIYNTHSSYIYEAERTGATLSLGRRFTWPDDFFRGDWTLGGQHSNIVSGGGLYTPGIHDEVSLQQEISRISTDNPVFPTSGSEFRFLTRLAYLPVASVPPNEPSNYFKNNFTMKFFTPLATFGGATRLVMATSADIGQLGGLGSTPYVPPTERFVMGGSGLASGIYSLPLRGYPDASIGIRNASTTSTYAPGGLAYARYVAELRYMLSMEPIPIYFLGFAEAGNVWTDISHADLFDLKRSAGLGARVQVPAVGLIGIDFGYGFDPTGPFGTRSGWQTHFQFGRAF
jgi:outer membrane protein insertion porin family